MPTCMEAQEANVETNKNGLELGVRNRNRLQGKGSNSSRVMEMGRIAETEKKESQNLEQIQGCIMLSEIWPQPKAQPLFFAPNLDLVHQ